MVDNDFYNLYRDTILSVASNMDSLRAKATAHRAQAYLEGVANGLRVAQSLFDIYFNLYDNSR